METSRLLSARLDDRESTAIFRAVLAALARPGAVVSPTWRSEEIPSVLLPLLALADLDLRFAILGDSSQAWGQLVASVTGARPAAELSQADMVVALRSPTTDELDQLQLGDALCPERGARLVIACDNFDQGATFLIAGPGASPPRRLQVTGVDAGVLLGLDQLNRNFPAGIDTWLVSIGGRIVGLPRSCTISATSASSFSEHNQQEAQI